MSRFRAVLFDFDYTLADSSRGVVECINYALRGIGLPQFSPEEIRSTIGLSLPNTLTRLVGVEHAERSREFARLFVERADQVMADLTRVLDDVPKVIGHLRDGGLALGIVSTKFRYRIEEVLRRAALLEPFDVIVGGEDVQSHKPDPESLLTAIEKMNGSPQTSVYVGDSVTDAETARRAEVPFIAVLSGVTPREAFNPYPVLKIVENLREIMDLI